MNRTILISIFYALTAAWAVGQVFASYHGGVHYVATTAIALAPTQWLIKDASQREFHIPHIVHPMLLLLWPIALPVYVIRTRRWRGLWKVFLHGAATTIVNVVPFYATIYFVWGPAAFG